MPKTLKNGRLVPSEPNEVLVETMISNDGTRTYFIRTYKNSIGLTEDQARFVEKTLFDDLPYTIEDDDDNPEPPTEEEDDYEPPTEEVLKGIDRLRGFLFDRVEEVSKDSYLCRPSHLRGLLFDSVKEVSKDV